MSKRIAPRAVDAFGEMRKFSSSRDDSA